MGQNTAVDQFANVDANGIRDNTGYAYNITLGFKINDMFTIEGGYGYNYGEDDVVGPTSAENEDSALAYYVQFPITLADGVFIIPELGKLDLDEGNGSSDEGNITYWGATWKIAF